MTIAAAPLDLAARHREMLDRAREAIRSRTFYSAFPESAKAYGETAMAEGQAAFDARLGQPFALAGATTGATAATERSPFGLPLDVRYAVADLDAVLADASAAIPVSSGVDISKLNFRYRIEGDNAPWAPRQVFDDGSKVYIEFPAGIGQGEMPPLFVIGPEGGAELVNYRARQNYYVVDRLFAAAELRLGGEHQQMVRIVRTDGRPRS